MKNKYSKDLDFLYIFFILNLILLFVLIDFLIYEITTSSPEELKEGKWECIQDIKFEYKTVVNGIEEIKEEKQCLREGWIRRNSNFTNLEWKRN